MNKKMLRDFLIPTPTQAFWCVILALLSVVLVYRNALLERLVSGQSVSLGLVGDTFTSQLANLNQYSAVQTIVIVIFWALVGLCAFAVYAAVRNSGSTVMDELTIQKDYTNASHDWQRFSWVAIRVIASILFLIALQIVWRTGLPFWFGMIEQFILGTITMTNFLSLILGIVGLSTSYYLLWVLLHAAAIADRL